MYFSLVILRSFEYLLPDHVVWRVSHDTSSVNHFSFMYNSIVDEHQLLHKAHTVPEQQWGTTALLFYMTHFHPFPLLFSVFTVLAMLFLSWHAWIVDVFTNLSLNFNKYVLLSLSMSVCTHSWHLNHLFSDHGAVKPYYM